MAKRGRKPTVNTEKAAERAADMLAIRMRKSMIRQALEKEFFKGKPIAPRSFTRILAEAKKILAADSGKSRRTLRQESREVYESVIRDPLTKRSVRVRAQQALDKLLGLPVPPTTRTVISGTGEGGAVKTESRTTVDVLNERVQKFDFDSLRKAIATAASSQGETPDASRN